MSRLSGAPAALLGAPSTLLGTLLAPLDVPLAPLVAFEWHSIGSPLAPIGAQSHDLRVAFEKALGVLWEHFESPSEGIFQKDKRKPTSNTTTATTATKTKKIQPTTTTNKHTRTHANKQTSKQASKQTNKQTTRQPNKESTATLHSDDSNQQHKNAQYNTTQQQHITFAPVCGSLGSKSDCERLRPLLF